MSDINTQTELLPLGSIITIEGSDRKLMIIGRALAVANKDGNRELYDYALVIYPMGMIGDAIVYTNREQITEVLFEGYSDEEDAEMKAAIAEALEKSDIPKAMPHVIALDEVAEEDSW